MADFSNEALPAAGEPAVHMVPLWDWIDLIDFVRPGPPKEEHADSGRCFWLSDTQINLAGPEQVWFTRSISEVIDRDGLQDLPQIDLDFDPAYERVVFHHVRVIRDGVVREVDPTAGISVFRRERDLEKARYDGRLTAHYVIPDVRVGDIVDVARSTIGAPPIFGDRFAAEWLMSWSCWVGETRVRVLRPPDKPIVHQSWNDAPAMTERTLPGGQVECTWRAVATAPVPWEPETANWVRRHAMVKACTPLSWREVADTFRGYYVPEPLPADLAAEADTLAAEIADPAARAVALLRKVQGGLRYQAVSIGNGGFVPRPVAGIWGARAGDCKDASRLLVALMAHVGLDAAPALVNTCRGWALADEAPSLAVFDHCIVRLRLEGEDHWLDPTLYPQGGDLKRLHQARFGWALPLVEDAELVAMGDEPVRDVWHVDERFELGPDPDSPATLTVVTTFGAWRADAVRRSLASEPASLARGYIDYYSRFFGEVTELEPLQAADELEANVLRVTERYRLGRAWTKVPDGEDMEFAPIDDLFSNHLSTAPQGRRRWAIDLGLPRRVSWTTAIRLPIPVRVGAWDRAYDMAGIRATSKHDQLDDLGQEIRLVRAVEVERQFLPPEEADAYFELRESALRTSGVTVTIQAKDGKFVTPQQGVQAADEGLNAADIWRWILVAVGAVALGRLVLAAMSAASSG